MNPQLSLGPAAYCRPSREYPYGQGACFRSLSLEEVSHEFGRSLKEWEDSTCPQVLSRMFALEQHLFPSIVITQCICIALGTFARVFISREDDCFYGSSDEANSPMRQLVALTRMLELLRSTHTITDVYFQDPLLNEVETEFLTRVGYKVLQNPQAKGETTNTTFLFAPHCEHSIAAKHLLKCFPALYVGNDPEQVLQKDRRCQEAGKSSIFSAYLDIPVADTFSRFAEATFVTKLYRKQNPMWQGDFTVRWLKAGSGISEARPSG